MQPTATSAAFMQQVEKWVSIPHTNVMAERLFAYLAKSDD